MDIMKKNSMVIVVLFLGISLAWIFFIYFDWLTLFDLKIYDTFLARSPPSLQDTNIVVVEYDDKTAENFQGTISREDMALLIHIIEQDNPRIVALDLFSMSDLLGHHDTSMILETVLANFDNLVYGLGMSVPAFHHGRSIDTASEEYRKIERFLLSPENREHNRHSYQAQQIFTPVYKNYEQSVSVGHLVLKNDFDGTCRRVPVPIAVGEGTMLAFGVQAAVSFLGIPQHTIRMEQGRLYGSMPGAAENSICRLDRDSQMMIRYNDRRDRIKEVSIIDVLAEFKNSGTASITPGQFTGKCVFIGNTSSRSARLVSTPLLAHYPALLVHATVANNVLTRRWIIPVRTGVVVIILACIGLPFIVLLALSGQRLREVSVLTLYPLFAGLTIIAAGYHLLAYRDIAIPVYTCTGYLIVLWFICVVHQYYRYKQHYLMNMIYLQEIQERNTANTLSVMAHQIKGLLNRIGANASVVKQVITDTDGNVRQMLGHITDAVNQLGELSSTILDVEKPDKLAWTRYQLKKELESVIGLIMPRNSALTVEFSLPERMEISADRVRFRQVFLNLAKNAFDAMGKEGTLRIEARQENGTVEIRFCDTGPGIGAKEGRKIFEPYFTTKKNSGGTGFGLPIVKQIVEAHGGTISLNTEAGHGAEFVIRIPQRERNE
jgi:signal transduction histidine kinase